MLLDEKENVYSIAKRKVYDEYEVNVQKEIFRLFSIDGQREVFEKEKQVPGLAVLERLVLTEVVKRWTKSVTVMDRSFWESVTPVLNKKAELEFDASYWERVYNSGITTYYEVVLRQQVNPEVFERLLKQCDEKIKGIENMQIGHQERLESSIESLEIYSYEELMKLFGSNYALKLRDSAHAKGICLKGEIPEDLILLEEFRNNGLTTKTYNCFARNRMKSLGDIITFKDEAAAKRKFFKLRGFGEGCWKNLLDFMDESGYTFAPREVKLEEYQKKIGSIK